MSSIDRRQGLTMLVGVAATTLIGAAAVAQTGKRRAASGHRALALVEKEAGGIGFYALPDGQRLGRVALGVQPHEIVADAAGRYAYVGGYGVESWKAPGAGGHQIWVIDLSTRTLVRTIDITPFGRIHGVRIDDRGRLYALSEGNSILARFDRPATDTAPSRLVPVNGARSHYLVIRRDGTRAYVADTLSGAVILVDPEDMGVAPIRRRIGVAPEGMALGADERTLYAIDRPSGTIHALDAATLEPRGERTMRGEAVRVVTMADGRLIVSNAADKSLSRLDPRSLAEEARLPLPAAAPGLNLVGDTLYVSLENDRVAIVDPVRWSILGGFATGAAPDSAVAFGA